MENKILIPKIGSIVKHTGWGFEKNKNYPCDVYIVSGNYEVNGRISNFWYWKRILPDGTLGDTEHGYGSFEETEKKYNIEISINHL